MAWAFGSCSRRIRGSALARMSGGSVTPRLPPMYTSCRPLAGKSSGQEETAKKPVVTTLDVLQLTKHDAPRFVGEHDLISEAMQRMDEHRISSLVVRDGQDRVVGFLTQLDLLRAIVRRGTKDEYSGEPTGWNVAVSQVMTPSKDLVFLSPTDTLEDARSLMAVSGKRHIPVLSGSTLLGILNPKDIAKYIHLSTERSAKAEYVTMVMPRKGMPLGTKLKAEGPAAGAPGVHVQLHSAVCLLPHPNKVATGGEDAYLLGPHMIGVADGVGSWWEDDIDPSAYSRALMYASRNSCQQMKREKELEPTTVLQEAWHKMQLSGVVGSSTVCLASLDAHKAELRAVNVGDSGFLLLRRVGANASAALGTLEARAGKRKMHIAFRSPQQLRAFNTPFQLGRAPDSGEAPDPRFETPHDASIVRVPVRPGDVLVLATDGLFDNMSEDDLLDVMEAASFDTSPQVLADRIAKRAQELSLDKSVDSPFALLAKDNDIMWGGGRPDDITVVVSFIVDCADKKAPVADWPARTGPGEPPPAIIEAERIMKVQREADRAAAERAAADGEEHLALWGS